MVRLDAGNVLLKPSHRKQLMGWLKRAVRLGEKTGNFELTVSMERTGRRYEARAQCHNQAGEFECRSRQTDWKGAARELGTSVASRLHQQQVMKV